MQREMLYNLQRTAYFIVAFFVFKMDKILSVEISTLWTVITQNFTFFQNKKYTIKIRFTL
jgi:hypothetical protein